MPANAAGQRMLAAGTEQCRRGPQASRGALKRDVVSRPVSAARSGVRIAEDRATTLRAGYLRRSLASRHAREPWTTPACGGGSRLRRRSAGLDAVNLVAASGEEGCLSPACGVAGSAAKGLRADGAVRELVPSDRGQPKIVVRRAYG